MGTKTEGYVLAETGDTMRLKMKDSQLNIITTMVTIITVRVAVGISTVEPFWL